MILYGSYGSYGFYGFSIASAHSMALKAGFADVRSCSVNLPFTLVASGSRVSRDC